MTQLADEAREILTRDGKAVDEFLRRMLAEYSDAPPRLIEAVEYSLMAGGKRLRPTLVLECWLASGGKESARQSALSAAAAVELIHTFSLVHDDLPSMDDDELRRGRPANHKVFGEAMAILAGDAMVTMAFDTIAKHAVMSVAPALARELASAAGPQGMIGGQVLDMDGEKNSLSVDELRRLHRMKTGALLRASCRLGALAAGTNEPTLQMISEFGAHLGLAFQIVDDILDVTSTPEQLGKATNKDADRGKNTYPAIIGLDASRREARHQLESALDSIKPLGRAAHSLNQLARFVVERDS